MSRMVACGDGEAVTTASACVLVRGGTDEKTGEALTAAAVAERIGWCAALVQGMAGQLVAKHWNAADVEALAAGRDAAGRPLPPQAWMALRRLGWPSHVPAGVVVNDRIRRMAQEQAGRILRSARWRAALIAAIVRTWPANPGERTLEEWDAVRRAVPDGERVPSAAIRARTRQVQRFACVNGRLPAGVFDMEASPRTARVLLLAACDRQQATIERSSTDPRRALLRVQLPVQPGPRSYWDWTWVAIPLILPPTIPAAATLHLPTLRVTGGRVRVELPFSRTVGRARRCGHIVALGVDWGLNTLLSAGAARLHPDGTITALGAGGQYRASGVMAKGHRLRRQGERLHAKGDHYERLANGSGDHPLAARAGTMREEARRVSERRSHLNDALAWSAARWTADQAITVGATVIYVEDLGTLEARGMGRTMNTRLSQAVRGQIIARMRHIAAEQGIAVVAVPPCGTSSCCPRCLSPLRHCKAPSQPSQAGWKWARCPGCGWQGDRDTGAWMRIAARGLTHQAKTTIAGRAAGTMIIRAVDDELEARAVITPYASGRDRSKGGPTRRRMSRSVPRRRGTPSLARPPGGVGQRPEGRATTAQPLPRAARRDQGADTTSNPVAHRPHRARGGTRRRLPPPSPRHPATTGTVPSHPIYGITEDH